jgi:hypothetical protein
LWDNFLIVMLNVKIISLQLLTPDSRRAISGGDATHFSAFCQRQVYMEALEKTLRGFNLRRGSPFLAQ